MRSKTAEKFTRFSKSQIAVLRRLDAPHKIQDFIDYELVYNDDKKITCFSPLEVLKQRRAHCIEGAMLAAAAFLYHGRTAWLLDLRANDRDDDHVLALFKENGRWGAIAQSHFCGLRYREPVYVSTAELARSYFDFYYNDYGEKTLREFSVPLNVSRLGLKWLSSEGSVFYVSELLDSLRHYKMLGQYKEKELRKADALLFEAEILGGRKIPLTHRHARPYSKMPAPHKH